ncbi:MAG: ComEC/Rec2 family competence protein, partial [Pseudomonadota bacterium]
MPGEPTWAVVGVVAVFCAVGLWAFDHNQLAARMVTVLCMCALAGAIVGKTRASLVAAPRLHVHIGPAAVEGVVSSVEAGANGVRLRIRVRAIEGLEAAETPYWVRLTHRQDLRVRPGRAVRCRAILSPPPAPSVPGDYNFRRQAYFQQLGAVGFVLGACDPAAMQTEIPWSARVKARLGAARRAIAEHVYASGGAESGDGGGGVAAAMVSGDRSFIAQADAEALRSAGLAHLLAISGLHMGLAGGVFFFGVRRLWPLCEPLALRIPAPKAAAATALIACTGYLALSGASVATQRAYVMASVALLAILLDRPALTLRLLALAMALVVFLQPETVTTPGFHMSFGASAALIALYEAWPRRRGPRSVLSRAGGWAASLAATSIVASTATAPFAIFHFGRTAAMSIPANLAAMPIVSLWTAPSAAMAAIAAPLGVSEPFFALMAVSLDWVLEVARFASELEPPITPPVMPGASVVLFGVGIALACATRGFLRAISLVAFLAASWIWGAALQPLAHVSESGTVYVRTDGEWRSWRPETLGGRTGLKPLSIDGPIAKLECLETPCRVETRFGVILLDEGA